jgi:hypothetical protein
VRTTRESRREVDRVTDVWLGQDDTPSHHDIRLPMGHLAVFGQTRRSGKTTTLRTLLGRLENDAGAEYLVFRTGTGEIPFPGAVRSTPHFRPRLDWQAVESMLWTFLSEKPKIYRPIIMRAVRGARTLEDVHRSIVAAGKKSRVGWVVDRTYELDTYFQEILPWLREHQLATEVRLHGRDGNLVDLEHWPRTVQQLVVASTLEFLMAEGKRDHPLVVVLPEAREFIPNDRATPVKLAADRLARMGAKLGLYLWIDSQALTGVDQQILRNFALLLQGVQTSDLEIRRVAKALEISPRLIRALKVGDFVLHTPDGVRAIHVPLVEPKEGANMDEKERTKLEDAISILEQTNAQQAVRIAELERRVKEESERAEANARAAAKNAVTKIEGAPGPRALYSGADDDGRPLFTDPSTGEDVRTKADLHVYTEVPDLTIHVKSVTIEKSEDDHVGRLAILLSEGFFDEKRSTGPISREYAARGWGSPTGGNSAKALRDSLQDLCRWGFLREFKGMYGAVAGARDRIRVAKEDA